MPVFGARPIEATVTPAKRTGERANRGFCDRLATILRDTEHFTGCNVTDAIAVVVEVGIIVIAGLARFAYYMRKKPGP
jgi:hypothetical protein